MCVCVGVGAKGEQICTQDRVRASRTHPVVVGRLNGNLFNESSNNQRLGEPGHIVILITNVNIIELNL